MAYVAAVPVPLGSFTVHNNRTDSYVVQFKVLYIEPEGNGGLGLLLFSKDIPAGKWGKIKLPEMSRHASIEHLSLKIEGFVPNGEPNTILQQSYPSPVHKCFEISGADMQPTCTEVPSYVAAVPVPVPEGSFTVHNNRTDSYVVRFQVTYIEHEGFCGLGYKLDSKDIPAGKWEKIELPVKSRDISIEYPSLEIQGFGPNGEPKVIFDQSYSSPVHKCFKIWGTDMQPICTEVPC
ncbi:hypothetical protein V9T40_001201 [Parthenolecanium corni]|uniref:Uncharacterized protein n=1 Tax=Parthenolecanium corni TaxID=536013 RepID=A0AAN9Y166_9HEMI